MKSKIKIFNISLCIALVFSILVSMVGFEAGCEELRESVFRIHIIANSDSKADQLLKLKVRDAILNKSETLFLDATSLSDAIIAAERNISFFEDIANETIKQNGYSYPVTVTVDKSFFGTRVYDDFTLPAGVYEALNIRIGKAEGKNWWCVLFPSICVGAAGDISNAAGEGAVAVAKGGRRFVMRFKIIEIYESIKNMLFS